LALRCSIRLVYSWSPPVAFARTDNSSRPLDATPRADSLSDVALGLTPSSSAVTGFVCACTHYLVFKEPTVCAPVAPSPATPPPTASSAAVDRVQGNLLRLLAPPTLVNPSATFFLLFSADEVTVGLCALAEDVRLVRNAAERSRQASRRQKNLLGSGSRGRPAGFCRPQQTLAAPAAASRSERSASIAYDAPVVK
jgi:hypothetical protein